MFFTVLFSLNTELVTVTITAAQLERFPTSAVLELLVARQAFTGDSAFAIDLVVLLTVMLLQDKRTDLRPKLQFPKSPRIVPIIGTFVGYVAFVESQWTVAGRFYLVLHMQTELVFGALLVPAEIFQANTTVLPFEGLFALAFRLAISQFAVLVQAAGLEKAVVHDRTLQQLAVPELVVLAVTGEQVLVRQALSVLQLTELVAGLLRIDRLQLSLAHVCVLAHVTVPSYRRNFRLVIR